jgi:hypothetical protein
MSARKQSMVIKITSRFLGMLGAATCVDAAGAEVVLAMLDPVDAAIADPLVFAAVDDVDECCESSAAGERAHPAVHASPARMNARFLTGGY